MAWALLIRSCTSCSSSISSPSCFRMCSKSLGTLRRYGVGSYMRSLCGPPDGGPRNSCGLPPADRAP